MAPLILLWFLLANTLLGHVAIATKITNKPSISVQSISAPSSNAPTISPSIGRKFGKQQHKQVITNDTPSFSPSRAPKGEEMHSTSEGSIPSHQKTSILDSQDHVHLGNQHHHHHSFDKSVAGGGVILGGLATTFLVSVYCYIRATARHKVENPA